MGLGEEYENAPAEEIDRSRIMGPAHESRGVREGRNLSERTPSANSLGQRNPVPRGGDWR